MWNVSILEDPLLLHDVSHRRYHRSMPEGTVTTVPSSAIVWASANINTLLQNRDFAAGGRIARVVLADSVSRTVAGKVNQFSANIDNVTYSVEPLDQALIKKRRRKPNTVIKYPPHVLERSDIWCSQDQIHITLRISAKKSSESDVQPMTMDDEKKSEENPWESAAQSLLLQIMEHVSEDKVMEEVACVQLQHRLRSKLAEIKAVAFIADGSILPRKSGTSDAPMASPPAIPFKAPEDSHMSQELSIDLGVFAQYLPSRQSGNSTTIHFRGLVVPSGVTLICGGGYHGKSTLLQTIAAGVYDKISGDGREYCVAIPDAVSVRAEDGRYVNNCNISAFISNLPTPPGVTKAVDTKKFSTRDSSGSTSQAANVSEAIEMGCQAMLIDEDISAANFMARDGRMRSLVMDESITPLLYRVNGLYNSHGISSVVVVGGVGDWLDVPHNVILLNKYVASDATAKAQSISKQFSHGHVQYAGRGVVHRLEWEKSGTPVPRRPVDAFSQRFACDFFICMMDGGHALSFHPEEEQSEMGAHLAMDDDDEYRIEASKLEQLLGRKQLFGCGLCVLWILQVGIKDRSLGLPHLLNKLDEVLDQGGLMQVLQDVNHFSNPLSVVGSDTWKNIVEEVGSAQRPRKHEVGQALTRMYGMQLEEIATDEDNSEEEAKRQAEEKRQELLKIWENRRKPRHSRFE
jgi:predicted ABC-class ATPase